MSSLTAASVLGPPFSAMRDQVHRVGPKPSPAHLFTCTLILRSQICCDLLSTRLPVPWGAALYPPSCLVHTAVHSACHRGVQARPRVQWCALQAVSEAGESVAEGSGPRRSSKGAVWGRKAEVLEQARPEHERRAPPVVWISRWASDKSPSLGFSRVSGWCQMNRQVLRCVSRVQGSAPTGPSGVRPGVRPWLHGHAPGWSV